MLKPVVSAFTIQHFAFILMSERKSFLLRLPPDLLDQLNRWARDDLRSLNAQIEYLLREACRRQRRTTDEEQGNRGPPPTNPGPS